MTAALVAAGIDAGQRYLDVGFAPSGKSFRVENTAEGIASLVDRLSREGAGKVVIEAIGPYAQRLIQTLGFAGFAVGVVNPRRIKAFRDAEGRHAKTDRLDARLMARFALVMTDALRPLPDADALALKALSTRRRQLTEMIAIEKTRLKQAIEPLILASHRAAITALKAQCDQIEAELAGRIAASPARRETMAILTSIPGIGIRIATLLVTDLPELGQCDRKAIASLAGLAPQISQSGNAPPRAAIAGGRPCVRAALYMAALVAARYNPAMKAAYQAMREQAKPAKVALVAIARKLIVLANALVKARKPYEISLQKD